MSQVATIFKLNREKLSARGLFAAAALMGVPLIILTALHLEHYWTSMAFGALYVCVTRR